MCRHEPDESGRCRATDLLPSECAGCRGSDTRFVDLLLASEPDPPTYYGEPDRALTRDEELDAYALRPVERDRFWLNTGKATVAPVALGHTFRSKYYGSHCQLCPDVIKNDQYIVRLAQPQGYAHRDCYDRAEGK